MEVGRQPDVLVPKGTTHMTTAEGVMTREAQIKQLCDELKKLRAQAEALCKELTHELHEISPDKPGRKSRRRDLH